MDEENNNNTRDSMAPDTENKSENIDNSITENIEDIQERVAENDSGQEENNDSMAEENPEPEEQQDMVEEGSPNSEETENTSSKAEENPDETEDVWRSSKKGIAIRSYLIPELKKAIDQAHEEWQERNKASN